jgi:hypothetical protein
MPASPTPRSVLENRGLELRAVLRELVVTSRNRWSAQEQRGKSSAAMAFLVPSMQCAQNNPNIRHRADTSSHGWET